MKGNIMNIKKPLHEKIRAPHRAYSCAIEELAAICGVDTDCSKECDDCVVKVFDALADEIEQNYELRAGAYGSKRLGIGADGLPICEGDEVYVAPEHARDCGKGTRDLLDTAGLHGYGYGEKRVAKKRCNEEVYLRAPGKNDGVWCPASWLTHTPPDTQERIDEGKRLRLDRYWKCVGFECNCCTLGGDGLNPAERYGVPNCIVAQGMDIARRQAELDALLEGDAR